MVKETVRKQMIEEELIELVKDRPLIYLKTHPEHCNAIAVSNAWTKIFDILTPNNFVKSHTACEKLWKGLWGQFLTHKRKCEGTTGDGGGRRPFFRHEGNMRFFLDKEFPERTHSNETEADQDSSEFESLDLPTTDNSVAQTRGLICTNSNDTGAANTATINCGITESVHSEPACGTSSSFKLQPRSHAGLKRQKPQPVTDFEQELIGVFRQNEKADEYEAFARSVGIKLRKLDGKKASEAMFRIHEVLYKIEFDMS